MSPDKAFKLLITILTALLCLSTFDSYAQTRIVVLDFELKDLTLKPGIPIEIARTASIKPMLESELKKSGFQIIPIPPAAQQQATAGTGYLFDHHDVAAQLARQYDADYVIVGRLHKPSFLFVYLMAHLIRVSSGAPAGDYLTEIKGSEKKLTLKGVESLAIKIKETLKQP